MGYLDRCYMKRCRALAVRKAAGKSHFLEEYGVRIRLVLGVAVLLQVLWATGVLGRFTGKLRNLVQVKRIEDQVVIRGSQNSFTGPGEAGYGGKIKEGVTILFDEKAIQIFRVEEKVGEGSD